MLSSASNTCPGAEATKPVSLDRFKLSAFSESVQRLPLTARIAVPVLAVTMLLGACLYPFYLGLAESRMALSAERRTAALADLLAISLASSLEQGDQTRVQRILNTLARDPQVDEVLLVDSFGSPIAGYPERIAITLPAALESDTGTVRINGTHASWRPVLVNGSQTGRLYLALKMPVERVRTTLAALVVGLGLTWALVVTFGLAWLARRRFSEPLALISAASRRVGEGDFDAPLPDPAPGAVGTLSVDFAAMLAQLRDAAEGNSKASDILTSLQDAVLLIDESGRIDASNPAARSILGYDESELSGTEVARIIDLTREGGSKQATFRELAQVRDGECLFICKDGRRMPMIFSGSKLDTGDGPRVVLSAHDLSQRIRQEEYLREAAARAEKANRAKSQFLAKMSHELRTPLNAILGFAQIQKAHLDEDSPDYLVKNTEHTLSAGWHLLNLINDVLDIARIEENNLRLSVEECKLGEVISHSRSLVLAEAEDAGIQVDVEDSPLLVLADYTRLKQVFVNLFSNAIKYNHRGGRVSFRAVELDNGQVECRIQDTGIGIPTEDAESIFEPFTRLQHAENNDIQGTGIGLALTRLLVELMGGRIRFTSEPGVGTTFYVELRPGQNQRNGSGRSGVVDASGGGGESSPRRNLTVFYVEDNPASLELMKAIMDPIPEITLLTATTAEEGIELAYKHLPDLMIFDINLPGGMDGVAAAQAIRSSDVLRHIPLIALSADATESSIEAAMSAGFDDYLTKPLDIDKLMRLVEGLPAARRELSQTMKEE